MMSLFFFLFGPGAFLIRADEIDCGCLFPFPPPLSLAGSERAILKLARGSISAGVTVSFRRAPPPSPPDLVDA